MQKGTLNLIELKQLKREINDVIDALIKQNEHSLGFDHVFTMHVDIVENDDMYTIYLELPGVKKQDVYIFYHRSFLEIRCHKQKQCLSGQVTYRLVERNCGNFLRILELEKPINANRAQACMNNGLLIIRLPKVEEKRGKVRIAID